MSPEQAIQAIKQRFGQHTGFRALHAKGLFCTGTFTATAEAAQLTRAEIYQGQSLHATLRFSNGAGDPTLADYLPDVRGLAVSFQLANGQRTDIVAQSAPRFPVRDALGFIQFMRAVEPSLAQLWRLPTFLFQHPHALGAMVSSGSALFYPPASYASIPYYGVHAFLWTAQDGTQRWVRYYWQPQQVSRLSPFTARKFGQNYLQEQLKRTLEQQDIRLALCVHIADDNDNPHDPSSVWQSKTHVVVGHLDIFEVASDIEEKSIYVFDPTRIIDGIELSHDPVLNFRPKAYSVSAKQRMMRK